MTFHLLVGRQFAAGLVEINLQDSPRTEQTDPRQVELHPLIFLNRFKRCESVVFVNQRSTEQIKGLRIADRFTVLKQRGGEFLLFQIDVVDFPDLLLSDAEAEIIFDPNAASELRFR